MNREDGLRASAARFLGEMGPAAIAVPALTAALRRDRAGVRVAAALALGEIGVGDASVVAALQALLDDADPHTRSAAERALAALDPARRSAAPRR